MQHILANAGLMSAFPATIPIGPITRKPLIVILDSRHHVLELSYLSDIAAITVCDARSVVDIHDVVLYEAFGALVWPTMTLTKENLQRFKALRIIVRIGVEFDNIDIKAAGELGIAVCNVPEHIVVEEVVDTTFCFILNLYRRTYWLANMVKDGTNRLETLEDTIETVRGCGRIRGQTLGIIGLGHVGKAVGLRAKVFGFNVIFYDPYIADGIDVSLGLKRVYTLNELFAQSNCISLHCSLNSHNYNMINTKSIQQMRKGVFLVNTAQGGLVNESALAFALKTGHIAAAALDVYESQPYNALEEPLKGQPNLIRTPHVAWCSETSFSEFRKAAAIEIRRAITGRMPYCLQNCVNIQYLITTLDTKSSNGGIVHI